MFEPHQKQKDKEAHCYKCNETICIGDEITVMPLLDMNEQGQLAYVAGKDRVHMECDVRSVIGSVGHQLKRCSCPHFKYEGEPIEDPPGLTKHESAIASMLQCYGPTHMRERFPYLDARFDFEKILTAMMALHNS